MWEWIKETLNNEWNALGYMIIGCVIIFVGLYIQDTISNFIEQLFFGKKDK